MFPNLQVWEPQSLRQRQALETAGVAWILGAILMMAIVAFVIALATGDRLFYGYGVYALSNASRGEDGKGSWGVHHGAPVWKDVLVHTTHVVGYIFEGNQEKPPPLFGGPRNQDAQAGLEPGFGATDELREQLASRRDLEVAVDRQHMVMDRGARDIEVERDLLLGIAHQQTLKDLEAPLGEIRHLRLVRGSELSKPQETLLSAGD